MDKNKIVGSARKAKGAVEEAVGRATGNAKLRAKGRVDKAAGTVQIAIGGVKDAARNALKKLKK